MKIVNFHAKIKTNLFAVLIGCISGLFSLIFNAVLNKGMYIVTDLYTSNYIMAITPFIVVLLIVSIKSKLVHHYNSGFGVSQVMYEIENIKSLVMKPLDVFWKLVCTLLSLIAGFSVGRQGPIVHMGGAIGSNIAYSFNLSDDDTRVMIGCGVAGCLAGVFNSPIFATLFVVEILFKKRYFDMITTILLASLTSTVIIRLIHNDSFFNIYLGDYHYDMHETIYFILLGLVMSAIAILYVQTLRKTSKLFQNSHLPLWIQGLIGASCIVLSLFVLKDYFFYNLKPTQILNQNYTPFHLILIGLIIILLTAISLGSGALGGIFAPGLFIGLTMGLAYGKILDWMHLPIGDVKTYAMAGMAAMYAGFAIAPLSSTLMIAELTGQYKLIFPLLLATLISSSISEMFIRESIYHKGLKDLIQ